MKKENKINIYAVIIGLVLTILLVYVVFQISNSTKRLIPLSIIALIAGVMFEIKKINEDWKTVLSSAFFSFLASFIAFLPGKRERNYNLEIRISIWPYVFIVFFIIATIAMNKKKVTAKLTEGTTLLLSIAVIYWTLDFYSKNNLNLFLIILFSIIGLFSLFSLFHAFTKTELTKNNRMILSIWSSIIFLLFAIDNIYRVYRNDYIEESNFVNGCYIALQYFLLGVSSIYMAQNFLMIVSFSPSKNRFFNKQYMEEIEELKTDHIERYSESQIRHLYSASCIMFAATIFYLNYKFQFVPRHMAIWLVFLIFPFLINFYEYMSTKTSTNNSPQSTKSS